MRLKTFKLLCLLSSCLFTYFVVGFTTPAYADIQIEITGNGGDTNNSVTVQNTQTTQVAQANDAQADSTVQQSANTGGNSQDTSTGGQSDMTTGDSTTTTSIDSTVNVSDVSVNTCCDNNQSITVSGNGEGSQNQVTSNNNNSTEVAINQTAVVNNVVSQTAYTGDNKVYGNGGDVSITTGSIFAKQLVKNSINLAFISVDLGTGGNVQLILKNNGEFSKNIISVSGSNILQIIKSDLAIVNNYLYGDFNTGGNIVGNNMGDVAIDTGDIYSHMSVINDPINSEKIEIICAAKDVPVTPPPGPTPETPPSVPPPTSGESPSPSSTGSSGGNGGSALAALTSILPVTGASAFHFWVLAVMYLLTFLFGLYLRLRAGRSPSYARYNYPILTY